MIFNRYQMMSETAVSRQMFLGLANGVWHGLETGHSNQRNTAPEQGRFIRVVYVSSIKKKEGQEGKVYLGETVTVPVLLKNGQASSQLPTFFNDDELPTPTWRRL